MYIYICVYIYIYICSYICMCIYIYIMYFFVCVYIYLFAYLFIHLFIYTYIYMYIHMYTYICYLCIYVYLFTRNIGTGAKRRTPDMEKHMDPKPRKTEAQGSTRSPSKFPFVGLCGLPVVSVVAPCLGLTSYVFRIP